MRRLRVALAAAAVVALVGAWRGTASAATLFSDNFDDGNAAGWSTSGGSWPVVSAPTSRPVPVAQVPAVVTAGTGIGKLG